MALNSTVADLFTLILLKHPDLSSIQDNMLLSLNMQYISPKASNILRNGDEVGLIPPISGG